MTLNPSQPLGIGLIGTGNIIRPHIEGYQAFPEACRIVAVADIDEARAQQVGQSIGPDVACYTDYQELLDRDDVQLVSICTPPFVHAPAAIAAMEAGKHVLVEKPMAASLAECDAMIAAAEKHQRKLSVVFQRRWHPDWWRAKALVESGLLGPLRIGKVDCMWWRGNRYYEVWWRGTWERECGGSTINHAVHHIDALLWFMGEPTSVYAELCTLTHEVEVEDTSLAVVQFASGAAGQILSTVSDQHNLDRIELTGEQAALSIPRAVNALSELENGFGKPDEAKIAELERFLEQVPMPSHTGHTGQIADMLEAIRDDRAPLIDGREGRRSLELISAIYKSGSTGERVTLPLSPDDPFYTVEGIRANVKRHPTGGAATP